MAKIRTNQATGFLILKIFLALFVISVSYFQWKKLDFNQFQALQVQRPFYLIIAIGLLPLNYLFEWLKWKLIIRHTSVVDRSTEVMSFFAGIITGMITPNMQGNFLGRMYYFPRRDRANIILLTLVANFGQFIVTLLFGLTAFALIGFPYLNDSYTFPIWGWLLIVSGVIVYFSFPFWLDRLIRWKWLERTLILLRKDIHFQWKIAFYSSFRYLIFSFQFLLVISCFSIDLSFELYFLIWQVYFWTSLAPSLFLGKLLVRESVSLLVLSFFFSNSWEIVIAAVITWSINLLLPTIIGLFICQRNNNV